MLTMRDYINSVTFFGVVGLLLRSIVHLAPLDERTMQLSWLTLRILSFGIPLIVGALILLAASVRSGNVKREEVNSWLGLLVCLPLTSLATMAVSAATIVFLLAVMLGLMFAIGRLRLVENYRLVEELSLVPMVLAVFAATQVMIALEHQLVLAISMATAMIALGRMAADWWIQRSSTSRGGKGGRRGGEDSHKTPPTSPGPNYADQTRNYNAEAAAHAALSGAENPEDYFRGVYGPDGQLAPFARRNRELFRV